MGNLQIRSNEKLYDLVYNNSIILLSPNDSILLDFEWLDETRFFEFIFTNKDDVAPFNLNWNIEPKNKIVVYLNKWTSETFVENPKTLDFGINQETKLMIKIRVSTKSGDLHGFAKFEISIYSPTKIKK